jgi:tRNA A-37 threonylcarbamoyl transferase component Bud32
MDEPVAVGRYQVEKVIGKGAMGVVYLAFDPQIGRQVALKTIRPLEGISPKDVAEYRERFLREAQAAGRLLHPNIVTIFDVFEDRGTLYIAMEYVEGVLLDRYCDPKNLLSPEKILRLMSQALGALHFAHRRGVVHRDIKPGNLMVVEDEVLKVMDFGVARQAGASLTQTGLVVGTPHYMAPEQIEGSPLDGRCDVFSVGVVLYELLTGERPFPGDTISTVIYHIINDEPAPVTEVNPRLPPALDPLVMKALAKRPEDRYPSARAFQQAMAILLGVEDPQTSGSDLEVPAPDPILPPPPSTGVRSPRRRRKSLYRTIRWVLGLCILGGGGALAVALWQGWRPDMAGFNVKAPPSQEQLPLPVAVTTDPPGALLFLDGQQVDAVTLPPGDKGLHVVEAKKGCLSAKAFVEAASPPSGGLTLKLAPGPSMFPVSSVPPGADILVDGQPTGLQTPASVPRQDCSSFAVALALKGYQIQEVRVDPSTMDEVSATLAVEPEKGALRVGGGSGTILVYDDATLLGRSGETITLNAGEHSLRFVDPAVRGAVTRAVTIEPGATTRVTLPPFETGRVFLYGKPTDDGKVYVDGTLLESLPLNGTVPLALGSHRFQVVSPDGRKVSFTWTITGGDQTRVVDFDSGRVATP